MGCGPSKEQAPSSSPSGGGGDGGRGGHPPTSKKTTKNNTKTTTTTTNNNVSAAVNTVMNETLKNIQRMSVVDQVLLARQQLATTTATVKTKARHLRNVFATPLQHDDSSGGGGGGGGHGFLLPSYPKSRAQKEFIQKAISQNFVFSNLRSSEIGTMIDAFEKISFAKDTNIIEQGQRGDYFYVIESGSVQFLINNKRVGPKGGKDDDDKDKDKDTPDAGPGDTFGELALLYSAPRAATCRAVTDIGAYRVDQMTFRKVLQAQTQTANDAKFQLLRNISFLQGLDHADLTKLVDTLTPRPFTKGEVLVQKGDDGDSFYVIQKGTVSIRNIEVGGQTYEDMELGPGDYFGERALLTQEPRTANCIAATDGLAHTVDRITFTKVMGNFSSLVLKASDRHKLEGIKVFQHTSLETTDFLALAELIVDVKFSKGYVLFKEGEETPASLYLVRNGQVKLTSTTQQSEYNNKTIHSDGFFGDDMLTHDATAGTKSDPLCPARYTATVVENCTLGILSLAECRAVCDTTRLGKDGKKASKRQSIKPADIALTSLKKHAILGAGTFGQVWLVSRETSDGSRHPYALKIQSKYELVKNSQARGVVQEKNIMAQLHHPFIINLVTTYKDPQRVYMLLEVVQGGELFTLMHKASKDGLPESSSKFYAAGIMEGLGYMHRRHILYRDLKPENVLIDKEGYPVIVDLGFAKYVKEKTYTLCGTPLYIAPEVILNRGHDKGADNWSLGCLIYEMICGETPFYKEGMDQISLFRAIVKGSFQFPTQKKKANRRIPNFSDESKEIISGLLVVDSTQRLGSLARGEKDIFRAKWFKGVHFDKLKQKVIPAPWIPKLKDPLDTSNFEDWNHLDDKEKITDPPISKKDEDIFKNF